MQAIAGMHMVDPGQPSRPAIWGEAQQSAIIDGAWFGSRLKVRQAAIHYCRCYCALTRERLTRVAAAALRFGGSASLLSSSSLASRSARNRAVLSLVDFSSARTCFQTASASARCWASR
jgi:hypothetical protein